MALFLGAVAVCGGACTDDPKSLQPLPPSPPQVQIVRVPEALREVPPELRPVFKLRCADCHSEDGRSGSGGNIFAAQRRTAKNWERFLRNPQQVHPSSKMPPVEGLTDQEYRQFAEWLFKATRRNQ